MKQQSKLLLSLLNGAGIGASLYVTGGLIGNEAVAGISSTRHNLGTTTVGWNRVTGGGTGEICVFCHTPHGADTLAANAPPLWNKKINTTGFTTYAQLGSSTLDSAQQNGTLTTGSVSLSCLSCHDGTQAMDNMINAPGSGGYVSDGGGSAGQTGTSWAWAVGERVDPDGKLLPTVVTNLTQDLRNDHPIGVAYCAGGSGTYATGTTTNCRDGDFKSLTMSGSGQSAQYYIETTNSSRDKSDIALYTRDFGGTNPWKPSVECGSCHDPHVGTKATNQVAFLRISQANSGICLACHDK